MKMYDFSNVKTNNRKYGGMAGSKLGIVLDDDNWLLKFPKSTSQYHDPVGMSYTTSALSEYIGSHIFNLLGVTAHETQLGIYNQKLVVACKDFRGNSGQWEFEDFHSIKNTYVEGMEEQILAVLVNTDSTPTDFPFLNLEEYNVIVKSNPIFTNVIPEINERFWDMFVIDALIGNNDRNNGNWGILVNVSNDNVRLAPVFDNGNSFSVSVSDERCMHLINDGHKFEQTAYESRTCFFAENGKLLNPLKYIKSMCNDECNDAILRIVPNLDREALYDLINEIPNEYKGIPVMSDARKEFYYKCIEYRIDKVLIPTYEKIKSIDIDIKNYDINDDFEDMDI